MAVQTANESQGIRKSNISMRLEICEQGSVNNSKHQIIKDDSFQLDSSLEHHKKVKKPKTNSIYS